MSLKAQAKSGMIWTFTQQFGTQIISFIVSIVLARLLQPSDFGMIALFGLVMGIAVTIVDGGLANSIIRSKDINDYDLSTVFYFNIIASIILYGIIYITAPLISKFYNLEDLTNIIRVYCLILIISAFATVQKAILSRNLNFKKQFIIQLPSLFVSSILGISLAYFGFGVWSLVFSAITQSILSTILFWIYSDWKPKILFDRKCFIKHFLFGYRITITTILNIIFVNIYIIIIGKGYSAQQLGYYNRADSLQQLPVLNLSIAINKVTLPLFSKISDDNLKLKEVNKRFMCLVIFVLAPVLLCMIVLAEPLVRFLLTEKWLPIVPYFQILALAGILYPIHTYNLNILLAKGRSDLFFKLEIVKKIVFVFVIVSVYNFGIYGLLWGQVMNSVLAFFINTYYTGDIINYSTKEQVKDVIPAISLSFFIGFFIYYLMSNFHFNISDFFILIIYTCIFLILYLLSAYLFKFKEIRYLLELTNR